MLPEQTPREDLQPSQIIAWLEEEQRRDKAEIQRFQAVVEQVLSRYRESVGRLELVEADLRQQRTQLGRVGHSEEGLREVREALVRLQEWQDEHQQVSTRGSATHLLENERTQRALNELQTRLSDLLHESELHKGRLSVMGEEMRRDQGNLPPVQQAIENLDKRLQGLFARMEMADEGARHRDLRTVQLSQHVERLAGEQSRFTDWQRLSEVRWSRQLTDWQGQMEEWRRQSEDAVREVASVAKSVPALRDDLAEVRRALSEERERGVERSSALMELASQRGVDREALVQAEGRLASLVARLDQVLSQCHVLAERLDRAGDAQQDLEGRLRAERERVEGIIRMLAVHDERALSLERRLEEMTKEIATAGRLQMERAEGIERNLFDLARRMDLRVSELERLDEEHKQREINELEQQIREMQERAKQAKG